MTTKSKTLTCWSIGCNKYGAQGISTKHTIDKLNIMPLPKNVHKINDIISCRNGSTYIIYNDDQLIVCGYNEFGQLGVSVQIIVNHWRRAYIYTFIPMDVINLISLFLGKNIYDDNVFSPMEVIYFRIKYVARGICASHQFVITHNNELYAIGNNDVQQLTFFSEHNEVYSFTQIHEFLDWDNNCMNLKAINCGYSFSTFLTEDGEIYTSGSSCRGFKRKDKNNTTLTQLSGLDTKIIDICCGSDHTLALSECGIVQSWGYNTFGQLGHKDVHCCDTPKIIAKFKKRNIKIVSIASGGWHNILLDNKSRIYCFGRDDKSQCGNENEINKKFDSMQCENDELKVIGIKCGLNHNVVRTNQNSFYLWGDNRFNQCLVFDNVKIVKTPTKFLNQNKKHNIVIQDIFPGYKETRVVTVTTPAHSNTF